MKVAILAGGLGTRLSEMTSLIPKPMVEIGGMPILWHIMKGYAAHGHKEFIVALGYKGDVVKDFFLNYQYMQNSFQIRLASGEVKSYDAQPDNWTVDLIDTGSHTQTGGRIKRLAPWLGQRTFMMTYGDGVSNVNIQEVLAFHRRHGKLATITAVRPPARFGRLDFEGDLVKRFTEKSQIGEGWINGGFFVLEPEVLQFIESDETIFEREPLERLAEEEQLMAFRHESFWQCMDTLRDLRLLERLWEEKNPPWKTW